MRISNGLLLTLEHDIRTLMITKPEYQKEKLEEIYHLITSYMKKHKKRLYKKWINYRVN